ncbi:MAG: GWxTD domain-containing protein [Candidatus Eisenbacteria bacterium]|uniref:GWxTD domain-containing protein n=1 Tax=Eiseniibacteriota bacterium TaxID=2212470 RepID=A0A948RRR1_UNCEI|nr:GWxTD domain-containing protein [Candidatus Eisenbacteria bacterium]MBU1951115.1 GWxTD domain-containing protein [Candidatus Eisenbacteria bacterium]MBU2689793.1 GWxTD domain-containing protein [Candidatus Eisenbacteria bacterium]
MPLFLEKLWMGSYLLTVRCRLDGKEKTERAQFELDETRVSLGAGYDSAIDMIEMIADEDELKKLRETPPEDRQEAWDEFWDSRDPEPETERNEFKEEFFIRVRYANEHFGVMEPGWRSDRGRIYIKYGAPDQIESFPQNQDRYPYEIWDYYKFRLRFIFVDYDGFGRYVLHEPGRF